MESNHIAAVEQYIANLYAGFFNVPGYVESFFDTVVTTLDKNLLWNTFNAIAYTEVFKASDGDISLLSDYNIASTVQTAIIQAWPVKYYLEKLTTAGIIHKFDIKDPPGFTYALKEAYIPVLNAILIEEDVRSGS